jgi:hypothetical protein
MCGADTPTKSMPCSLVREFVRIESLLACVSARSRPPSVSRIRVSALQDRKSTNLRDLRKSVGQTGPRYLSGGFIDCRTSMRACWLTVRVPSCGRSRSAISAMTEEKVTATTMTASDRIVPTSPA